jgi:hypothetical protein
LAAKTCSTPRTCSGSNRCTALFDEVKPAAKGAARIGEHPDLGVGLQCIDGIQKFGPQRRRQGVSSAGRLKLSTTTPATGCSTSKF